MEFKATIAILLFILSVSGIAQMQSKEKWVENVKKEKLNEAKTISEIIPNYPKEYNKTIDYVAVKILATCKGITMTSKSMSNKLTTEQKNILNTVDEGTNIGIEVKFKYKDQKNDDLGSNNKVKEMAYVIKVSN